MSYYVIDNMNNELVFNCDSFEQAENYLSILIMESQDTDCPRTIDEFTIIDEEEFYNDWCC